jgi:hypothetical protein
MYKAVLGPLAFPTSAVLPTAAYGPLIDRIFVLVAAVGRSMTYQSPVPPPPNLGAIARLGNVLGAQQVQTTMMQLAIQQTQQQEQAQNPPAGPTAAPVAVAHAQILDPLTPTPAPVRTVTSISPTSPIRIPITSPTAPHSPVLGTVNPIFLNPIILQHGQGRRRRRHLAGAPGDHQRKPGGRGHRELILGRGPDPGRPGRCAGLCPDQR